MLSVAWRFAGMEAMTATARSLKEGTSVVREMNQAIIS